MTGTALSAGNPSTEKGSRGGPFFRAGRDHNTPFTIFLCVALTLPPDIWLKNPAFNGAEKAMDLNLVP